MSTVGGTGKHSFPRMVARFLLGRPMDGQRRTDATFLRPGTRSLSASAYVTRVDFWPGAAVLLLRLVLVVGFPSLLLWVWWDGPAAAELACRVEPFAVVLLALLAWRAARRWRLVRHIVRPLAEAAAGHLGYAPSLPASRVVKVPPSLVALPPSPAASWWQGHAPAWVDALDARMQERRRGAWLWRQARSVHTDWVRASSWCAGRLAPFTAYRRARMAVRLMVPHSLGVVSEEVRTAVVSSASVKLGGAWDADWQLRGARAAVLLRPRPAPPTLVTYATFRERMELAGPTELAIGMRVGYRTVSVDLDSDSPHLMLSMGSGAGKSVLIRSIAAQALAKGWAVVLLDFKQDHYWCADLIDEGMPGLVYIRKIPDIHNALLKLEAIRDWRSDVDFAARGKQEMQRVVILFEEMNASVNMLRTYWAANRQKGEPVKSPALTAVGQLSAAGRSARMNLVGVGQYLTAQVFGGPEARENFGSRILSRYTAAAWRTLVPECGAPPPRSSVRGRLQVCQAGGAVETQGAFITHAEVREHAMAGLAGVVGPGVIPFSWELEPGHLPALVSPVPSGGHSGSHLRLVASGGTPDPVWGTPGPTMPPALEARRTMPEWCDLGVVPWAYPTAKKHRQRDLRTGRWPLPAEQLTYSEEEITAWVRQRVRV